MNDIVAALGLEAWKPVASALLMPPLPFLLLVLVGARLMFRRRVLAWLVIVTAVALIWFTTTTAAGKLLRPLLMTLPPPLSGDAIAALKTSPPGSTAIVVLGGGRKTLAPEYGLSSLRPVTLERLRYGLWLSRETGLPVAFSGGVGHGAGPGPTEADVAVRIAEREFGRPLRWAEERSRDTIENGLLTVPPLQAAGISRIVLVTSDLHQPRALRAFRRAAEREGKPLELIPAPIGVPAPYAWSWTDFMPSADGFTDSRMLAHEWLGYWLGA